MLEENPIEKIRIDKNVRIRALALSEKHGGLPVLLRFQTASQESVKITEGSVHHPGVHNAVLTMFLSTSWNVSSEEIQEQEYLLRV